LINHHTNGKKTVSESIRLYRNVAEMVYYGRVHETFDKCLPKIEGLKLLRSPFKIHHQGYLKTPEEVEKKIKFYNRLSEMQMRDDPSDPIPYYSLALHYLNKGNDDEGVRMLIKAIQKKPSMWLAKKELAYHHLFQARDLLNEICEQLPQYHPFWKLAAQMADYLAKNAGSKITVGIEAEQSDV